MAPILKGFVRESLNRKVLPNNADTIIFNKKPQLYTIIHYLQLSYIPRHSCFTASARRPPARRPPARRPALPLALGQHWPNISSHVIQQTRYIIIGVGTTLAQHIFISLKPSTRQTDRYFIDRNKSHYRLICHSNKRDICTCIYKNVSLLKSYESIYIV